MIDIPRIFWYNKFRMDTRGKFIVFEGLDGSGKSTQMKLLSRYLEEHSVPNVCTHEPTDSPFGALVHGCMSGKVDTGEYTIAAMFAADRLDHIQNPEHGILSRLGAGVTVLCDRYYFSSFAYNGGLVPLAWVEELNRPAMELLRPDLVLFLDLPPEAGMERVGHRAERERYETLDRQQRTRENFLRVFEKYKESENIVIVKSGEKKERTQAQIRTAADALFGF